MYPAVASVSGDSAPNAPPRLPAVIGPVSVGFGMTSAATACDPARERHITSVPLIIDASCFMGSATALSPFPLWPASLSRSTQPGRLRTREYALLLWNRSNIDA